MQHQTPHPHPAGQSEAYAAAMRAYRITAAAMVAKCKAVAPRRGEDQRNERDKRNAKERQS